MQASLTKLTTTKLISRHPKLSDFRANLKVSNPSLPQTIEVYALSCLLRLVGRFTREKRWEQARGLIKRSDFWEFVRHTQPWITNNRSFSGIAEEKLKYFAHDDENYKVTNFDFIYERVKGLIENFWINPTKLEGLFTKPVRKREGQRTRSKRKDPETAKLRSKLARFRSRSSR
jgi:hypothetical protein